MVAVARSLGASSSSRNHSNTEPVQACSMSETPSSSRTVNGKIVMIVSIAILIAVSFFTYYIVPDFVTPYLKERPGQLEETFDAIEAGLLAYASDHGGEFPPEDVLIHYRRRNKNLYKTRSFGITTYRMESLTSPHAYLDHATIGDPFAMPEQFSPPGYFWKDFPEDNARVALLFSPGPNLMFEMRNISLREIESLDAFETELTTLSFDPTNGAKSSGDLYRLVKIPLESESESGTP